MNKYFLVFFVIFITMSGQVYCSQECDDVVDWQYASEASFADGGATMQFVLLPADGVKLRISLDDNFRLININPEKLFVNSKYSVRTNCVIGTKTKQTCEYTFAGNMIAPDQFSKKAFLMVDFEDKNGNKIREAVRPWGHLVVYPSAFDFSKEDQRLSLKNVSPVSVKQLEGFVLNNLENSCDVGENHHVVDMSGCNRLRPDAVCDIDVSEYVKYANTQASSAVCLKFKLNNVSVEQRVILSNTNSVAMHMKQESSALGADGASREEVSMDDKFSGEEFSSGDVGLFDSVKPKSTHEGKKYGGITTGEKIDPDVDENNIVYFDEDFVKKVVSGVAVATVVGVIVMCRARCCGAH